MYLKIHLNYPIENHPTLGQLEVNQPHRMDSNSEETRKIFLLFNHHPSDFDPVAFIESVVLNKALLDKHTIDGKTTKVRMALSREKQQTNVRPKCQYLIDNSDVFTEQDKKDGEFVISKTFYQLQQLAQG